MVQDTSVISGPAFRVIRHSRDSAKSSDFFLVEYTRLFGPFGAVDVFLSGHLFNLKICPLF